jgi:hypothetical protein
MGESFEIEVRRNNERPDDAHLADLLARTPADRLELAIGWNRLAGEVALAGRRALGERGSCPGARGRLTLAGALGGREVPTG